MLSAAPFSRSPDRNRVAILVMGMHRSGTSALAWLLGQMGATLPRDEMPASAENAKGYWESSGLVKADEQLIRAAGSSWFDPRPLDLSRIPSRQLAELLKGIQNAIDHGWGDASLLAIKDPRQCRFVPTIVAQLEKMGIAARAVLMLRNAAEVAASIARRDATTASYAQLLWLRHMLDAERDTRALPRTIVSYDGLMGNWRATATRLAPLLGCEGWSPDDDGATIEAYLDQNLRHHHLDSVASQSHEIDALIAAAEHGFAALTKADDTSARAVLDQVRARLAATPWLEGDVVHDELRHRRVPAVALSAPEPSEMDASSQEPPPPFNEVSDPESDVALIRSSGLFDTTWYCGTYLEVQESGLDPIEHYLRVGAAKGYNPNPLFDTGYYARQMARRSGSESL